MAKKKNVVKTPPAPPPAATREPRIELYAGLLLAVGFFLGISFIFYSGRPNDQEIIGYLGTYLVKGMEMLLGPAAILLPVIIILWALYIFVERRFWSQRLLGMILLYISVLIYFSVYQVADGLTIWEAARSGLGGGYIGSSITFLIQKLLGNMGVNLLIVLLAITAMVLVIDRPLMELAKQMKKAGHDFLKFLDQLIFYEEETTPSEPIIVGVQSTPAEPHIADIRVKTEKVEKVEQNELPFIVEDIPPAPRARKKGTTSDYNRPPLDMLVAVDNERGFNKSDIKESIKTLEDTFNNFGIKIKVNQVSCGPSVTRYELQPAPGVKVSKILSLTDDLQLSLAARGIRIEAPIPGKSAVGIEVPNEKISSVGLRNLLSTAAFQDSTHPLTVALGEDISGTPVITKLADMPHLLIAGATGSGKSVCLNGLILSLLYKASPQELKLVLIDPKMVELTIFNGIPHLMAPVVTDPKKAALVLRWMSTEMEKRYRIFAEAGVRDIYRYNEVAEDRIPFIVIVIDELADLMMVSPVDVEDTICRLAQMARAAGIHLVVATQRPSVDVVTGIIKANIPSRIAFAVSSQADSRTILDAGGAEKLLGRGDMLFCPVGAAKPLRVQGAYVSDSELERVVEFLRLQNNNQEEPSEPSEWDKVNNADVSDMEDELFWDAVKVFVDSNKASVSLLQRKLRIGYARAARLVDIMEERGIISEPDNYKKREILIDEDQLEKLSSRQCL
ncbi:MAG: DNA translocase FtsK [Ignavibacteriales bacterium]